MYDSIKMTNGDISFDALGKMEFVSGKESIMQYIEHKINTMKEQLFYDLNYGIAIDWSKLKKTDANFQLLQSSISNALSNDDRISSAYVQDITNSKLTLEITLTDDTVLNIILDKG